MTAAENTVAATQTAPARTFLINVYGSLNGMLGFSGNKLSDHSIEHASTPWKYIAALNKK